MPEDRFKVGDLIMSPYGQAYKVVSLTPKQYRANWLGRAEWSSNTYERLVKLADDADYHPESLLKADGHLPLTPELVAMYRLHAAEVQALEDEIIAVKAAWRDRFSKAEAPA